ncbi:MAG: ribosome assembly RNA-binding protein YhbY [bacterium]
MLTAKQRKFLRGLAHPLRPVTQVGLAGISEGVIGAVSAALTDHELIKVRLLDPADKRAMAGQLAEATRAELCGLVGHTVILYRRHPEKPRIELPS